MFSYLVIIKLNKPIQLTFTFSPTSRVPNFTTGTYLGVTLRSIPGAPTIFFSYLPLMNRVPKNCTDPKFQFFADTITITRVQVPHTPAVQLRANMQIDVVRGTWQSLRRFVVHRRSMLGQKFLTHQFTFLDPPIFLVLKLILPTTSLKPAFLTHQCLPTLSRTTKPW